jgi:hypothetical protein
MRCCVCFDCRKSCARLKLARPLPWCGNASHLYVSREAQNPGPFEFDHAIEDGRPDKLVVFRRGSSQGVEVG